MPAHVLAPKVAKPVSAKFAGPGPQAGNREGGLATCRSCWTGNNLWELHWFLLLRPAIDLQDLQFQWFWRSLGWHGVFSRTLLSHQQAQNWLQSRHDFYVSLCIKYFGYNSIDRRSSFMMSNNILQYYHGTKELTMGAKQDLRKHELTVACPNP